MTLGVWNKLYDAINSVVDGITLADMIRDSADRNGGDMYCI